MLKIDSQAAGLADVPFAEDRDNIIDPLIIIAMMAQQFGEIDGVELAGLQIDHIDLLGRIADHLIQGHVHPQAGLAGRNHDRVVVGDPVDRPGAQSGHDPHQPVGGLDATRPAEFVAAEGYPGKGREKILPDPLAHHLLDHDAHLLVEIQ